MVLALQGTLLLLIIKTTFQILKFQTAVPGKNPCHTPYMQDAVDVLRGAGKEVLTPDIARLSPLTTQHINFSGKYHFDLPDSLSTGQHRPWRELEQSDEEP